MRKVLLILALLLPASVSAQVAPAVVSTLKTTSTATTSIQVGCAVGSAVCTGGIVAGPIDVTSVTSGGFIGIASSVPGSTTYRLYNNAGTLFWNGVALATGASLSGTINKIPVFTAANAVGDSIMTQSGTTITVANTLAATTGTFTNIGGTLTTASQTAITGVGTLTAGTWNATAIGLQYGGTGANLSGTGGTSQFLRQNSLGGGITVVRPAIADLSDASNVALLNAANTFTAANPIILGGSSTGTLRTDAAGVFTMQGGTSGFVWRDNGNANSRMTLSDAGLLAVNGFGSHSFSSGGTGASAIMLANTTSGTGNFTFYRATAGTTVGQLMAFSQGYTTGSYDVQASVGLTADGAGGLSVAATNGSGAIRFYSGGTSLRFGINAAGDWLKGTTIMDSTGTPTINSGFGASPSIAGTDYAFVVTHGTGALTSGTVAFGHAFATAPICTASTSTTSVSTAISSPTTTTVGVNLSGAGGVGDKVYVHCRGY